MKIENDSRRGEGTPSPAERVDEAMCVPALALLSVTYAHSFGACLAFGIAGSLAFWPAFAWLVLVTLNLVWIRWIMRRAAMAAHEEKG